MSSDLRLKKLRGSGGYVMANVTDEQQMKGNLGGPDLFLAPIGRLDAEKITKYFCNTCEKEYEKNPKIEFENPNEEVAENLVLVERGQYICNNCSSTLAEYREFKKTDERADIGLAKPISSTSTVITTGSATSETESTPSVSTPSVSTPSVSTPSVSTPSAVDPNQSIKSIEGLPVYDENAKKIGLAKQVGVDSNQSLVLVVNLNDGKQVSIPWGKIQKIGEIIILGTSEGVPKKIESVGKCNNCGFNNKPESKFCEECGSKL